MERETILLLCAASETPGVTSVEKGHISSVCCSKKKPSYRSTESVVREQYVTTTGFDTDEDLPIKFVGSRQSQSHPIIVPVSINGKQLSLEVDTGAAVSILSEKTFQSNFLDAVLKPAAVTLRTYTGQPMPVVGQLTVLVKYQSQLISLSPSSHCCR